MDAKVDASALTALAKRLEQTPQVLAEAKRWAFTEAAPKLKAAVDAEIGGTGKVRSWQGAFVGSRGGYAAVRPKKGLYSETKGAQKGFRAGPKKYAVGYITNAINQGHKPPRSKFGFNTGGRRTPGKQFYQRAQADAQGVAQEAGEQIIQAIIDHLEG